MIHWTYNRRLLAQRKKLLVSWWINASECDVMIVFTTVPLNVQTEPVKPLKRNSILGKKAIFSRFHPSSVYVHVQGMLLNMMLRLLPFYQKWSGLVFVLFAGIPTDEEQATGMERIIMKAMQEGSVRSLICGSQINLMYLLDLVPNLTWADLNHPANSV